MKPLPSSTSNGGKAEIVGAFGLHGISWIAVTPASIWVRIKNHHFAGFGAGDARMSAGEVKLGRLDRRTSEFNLQDNIASPLIQGTNVGPTGMLGYRPDPWDSNSPFWVGILGDDGNSIWLSAIISIGPALAIKLKAYGVNSILWSSSSRFMPHTPPDKFLWFSNEELAEIRPDGNVKRLSISGNWFKTGDAVHQSLWFLAATSQRVWYYTDQGQLVTLTPGLSEPHEIAQGPLFGPENSVWRTQHVSDNRGSVAVGDNLYTWSDTGHLLGINGTTGTVSVVESWMPQPPSKDKQQIPPYSLIGRNESAFVLPDGRITFTFSELQDRGWVRSTYLDRAHQFIYDPIKDTWQESDISPQIRPVPTEKQLYGYDSTQIYHWKDNGWTASGKRPLATPPTVLGQTQPSRSDERISGTTKFFYAETAIGLYRVLWSQLTGREMAQALPK